MGCISRLNLCPASGDTENVLLQKILQSLNEGAGGGGGGAVSSVNGQTGAVVLTTDDISEGGSNLYFTDARAIAAVSASGAYLLKAGDTGTGPFFFTPTADNTVPLTLTNSLTGASLVPTLEINPTWNTTGAPTALKVNVLNTASAAAANIFDFQLGSTPVFHLRRDGRLTLAGRAAFNTTSGIGHALAVTDAINTAAVLVLTLQHVLSAGTAAAGLGIIFDHNLDSTTTSNTRAVRWVSSWTDATHATRTAQTLFQSFVSGVETVHMILANGQVQGNPGSVTIPSFTNRNDSNTGIYFPAADSLGFTAGGVAQASLTGTNLNVVGNITGSTGFFLAVETGLLSVLTAGDGAQMITTGAGNLTIQDYNLAPFTSLVFDPFSANGTSIQFGSGDFHFRDSSNSAYVDLVAAHLQLFNSTALGADPTTAAELWATSGEFQYRTSGASEGSGQTNRVHNRSAQVAGAGTNYTLTTSLARIDFGTTDPEIVLPTAGTYLVSGIIEFVADAASVTDTHNAILRNSTDASFVGQFRSTTLPSGYLGGVYLSQEVTVTASKTIQLWASNDTAARGVVSSTRTYIKYVRLY